MALVGPILDDRTYAQLRDELVRRIPVYAPEWTDHNESDPGIALLELFAYLGESLLYRFNQIPDATKIAFLRLLALQPRGAQIASTLLVLRTEQPAGVQVLRGTAAKAGSVDFRTADEVVAWPLEVVAVGKKEVPPPDPTNTAEQHRRDDAVHRLDAADQQRVAEDGAAFYVTTTVPDDPMAPAAEPLDVATTIDGALWVALLATGTTDVTTLGGNGIFLGVAMDEGVQPTPYDLEPAPPPPGTDPPARTLLRANDLVVDPPAVDWELWNGPPQPGRPDFVRLSAPADTTRGLTTTGVVTLDLPRDFPSHDKGVVPAGGDDSPPPLGDTRTAGRVIGWVRASRPAQENDAIHRVRWVGINVVGATQTSTAAGELLGVGTGDPDQTVTLTRHPVVAHSVQLEVEEADGWRRWTEVADAAALAASTGDDRPYLLDATAGIIRFGSSRTRVPQIGQRIRATTYLVGGGAKGDVPVGAITSLTGVAGVKVTNPLPGRGGADPATLDEALDAVPAEVARRDRAVTADDFRTLAGEVAGVARADVLPTFHPDTPRQPAAGVVTVVVFPREDQRAPNAPEPDVALLRLVATYLNDRRLMTTELYVVPPTYRPIAISVGVRVQTGYQVDAVRRWVELILRQYLAPLPPYGPDGGGWPLGRAVRRAELMAVAVQVEGVDYLENLLLARLDDLAHSAPTDHVDLQRWEVPEVAAIVVVVGTPPPVEGSTPGTTPPTPLPVPLPPDVC